MEPTKMGQLFTNEELEQCELKLFNFVNDNCLYRVRTKYGEEQILRWTGKQPDPVVKDSSGQFYFQRALMDAESSEMIGNLFWDRCLDVWKEGRFQIAGNESSSIAMVLAIQLAGRRLTQSIHQLEHGDMDVNGFYVRKEQKLYGLENWTEGRIEPNVPVMMVDDSTNSKAQMRKMYTVLIGLGFHVLPVAFSFIRFDRNDHTLPVNDMRYIFRNTDFAKLGEPWEPGSFDKSIGVNIENV